VAWLERWQPQALIVEANPRYRSTPAAVRWMHARGLPVLGWGLGAPPLHGPLAGWRRRARRRFLASLDGMIAYSQRGADEYRRTGFPAERVFVAPNAAAPRPSSPPPARPPGFMGQPQVLFVGRLQQRKRLDNLLQACAALPADLQPRLQIVGDGPARPELEALARSIYPGTEFSGARYGDELAAAFALADLFVLPGTGGLAVQQAMSFGLPVIVAEGDGTQDDLVRPGNGWQIPADDLEALKTALQAALADAGRLRRMGAESYRIVAEEANLERMVQVFINALVAISAQVTAENSRPSG
jgi:glycosyltransferase involved in cell wall biosynthesis